MKKDKHEIKAEIRTVLGRKVKLLRKEGLVPATVYGHKFESISIQMPQLALEKIYDEAGESALVHLIIDGKELPVLLRNCQYHPVTSNLIHIDCYKVNLKEKITTFVPIELIGESAAVKNGNTLMSVTEEIEVEALPTNLPENITVDISVLEDLDSVVTVADLNIDREKVEVLTDAEQVVVKVEAPREEEEIVVEEEAAAVEVPATAQKTEEEKAESEA
ncbi:MAG: 50S ribosomal protein L25 [Candidatus Shapirobacteria bacterium]